MISLACIGSDRLHISDYRVGVIALLSALLVLIASYNKDYISRIEPMKELLLWLGTRSYAIYLIHFPAYLLTREIWYRVEPAGTLFDSSYSLKFILTATAILIMLSELNYRLIETPLRNRGARIAKQVSQRELPLEQAGDVAAWVTMKNVR